MVGGHLYRDRWSSVGISGLLQVLYRDVWSSIGMG